MFTGVARLHPRHDFSPPSQNFSHYSHLYALSPDVGNHDNKDPLGETHAAKKVQRTCQYAYPSRSSTSSFTNRITIPNVTGMTVDASEHMLRRKTPNGTLAAGYDGTPVEWTKRPNTFNDTLISGSTSGNRSLDDIESNGGHELCIPLTNVSVKIEDNINGLWNQKLDVPQDRFPSLSLADGEKSMNPWTRKNIQSFGLDSMLNQAPISHQFYHAAGFHQAPTVLQPMWPPYIESMGLNDPYSSESYSQRGSHQLAGAQDMHSPSALDTFQSVDRWPVNPIYGNCSSTLDDDGLRRKTLPTVQGHSPWTKPLHNAALSRNSLDSHNLHSVTNQSSALDQLRYGTEQIHLASLASPGSSQTGTDAICWKQNAPRLLKTSPSHFNLPNRNPLTNNLHFKEKVLVWAHRTYINLLAYHHQNRKNMHNKHNNTDRQSFPACIYPRPPGRSPCTSRGSNTFNHKPPRPSMPVLHGPADAATFYDSTRDMVADTSEQMNESRSNLWPPLDGDFLLSAQQVRGWWRSRQHQNPTYPFSFRGQSLEDLERVPLALPNQHQDSAQAEARRALEIITRLCQESDWQWTDGVLLGGCLAYGLAEYDQALQWYLKVLSYEPCNVEAISNVAVALLSLNRREEAEQYWVRSVKLRPNYFEAVEHLIGLLCGDHRGKDAVRIIEFIEAKLRLPYPSSPTDQQRQNPHLMDEMGWQEDAIYASSVSSHLLSRGDSADYAQFAQFNSCKYAIPSTDNGRMLALVHCKGNMLYALGDNMGAAKAFEEAILIGAGRRYSGIGMLIRHILQVFSEELRTIEPEYANESHHGQSILLQPEMALQTAKLVFSIDGQLPGLKDVSEGNARNNAVSTMSNSLLSLAKIYQDSMSSSGATADGPKAASGVQDILALYYLSLSLQPSPSTANNVGILLASVQQPTVQKTLTASSSPPNSTPLGVVPGSGVALALAYYNYGLNLDSRHAHLYTNLGSLLKDLGQLGAAIKMYEKAVLFDGTFDIALANLANAVKDQGRIGEAIGYYKRAVSSNPEFAEAVCGLANALNSVCSWKGRGGIVCGNIKQDRWHVNEQGMLMDAKVPETVTSGWIGRVVSIVEKQLNDGEAWGRGVIRSTNLESLISPCTLGNYPEGSGELRELMTKALEKWTEDSWEGARVVRLVERATKRLVWQMYQEQYVQRVSRGFKNYSRPQIPPALAVPSAPTVLPFHTFTCPLTAKQIRKISQRNGLRISCSTLRAPWLPSKMFDPPAPPAPCLNVGYVSSDFNNHPLAHLMQSVFGFHDVKRIKAFCYATTASDKSVHREQIQREAPHFYDASSWSMDRLVNQIVEDGIHILINLNGYTRGARNEVFAARPAPIQMSFMGFAGTLGAEWCDYLLADETAIPRRTLRPWRKNVDLIDQTKDFNCSDEYDDWVYGENIIYTRDTFFCCDHRQSAPDSQEPQLSWPDEQRRRWKMRKELFPDLPDDAIIFGNFNQLYKIEPTTFRTWLRILQRVPKAVLWLLRFPDLGEENLRETAILWAGKPVENRIIFTDVAPKHQHISRARICDLFLDTPECNAHTTAADVLWSGTPLLTFPRYEYKMCSRMAASILKGALPKNSAGVRAREDLIVCSDEEYEQRAVRLGDDLSYASLRDGYGRVNGRLTELRKLLYESRWTSALFDTRRWVRDLEEAYEIAWRRWVAGEGGDIWLGKPMPTA